MDNGTEGKYGAEIFLRKNLERHISRQMRLTTRGRRHGVPVVTVVLEVSWAYSDSCESLVNDL